jgi:hypothetical protein
MISIYKSVQQTFDKNYISVDTAIERIKNSRYKDRILKMRTLGKDEYTSEKNKLPVYRWSGIFEYGNDAGIKTHSGLICLDFDKYPSDEVMSDHRKKLCSDPYVYILFTSPSGKGLKVVVKITDVIENHRKHFLSLKNHFDSEYWDNSSINISRNCFDSYDPDIYVNKNSEVYLSIIEEVEDIDVTYVATIPMRSTNKIIQNIQKWFDSKYQLSEGNRNNSFFNLASAFNRYGIQQSECENYILTNYVDVLEEMSCYNASSQDIEISQALVHHNSKTKR